MSHRRQRRYGRDPELSVARATIDGMTLARYRDVLGIPGVSQLTMVALLARVPVAAAGVVLALHVVLGLERGYGAAGLVGGAGTIGAAVGAPIVGRVVDRYGLRPMLVVTTVANAAFWLVVPWLPYAVLAGTAFVGGMLSLPVFSVVRQSLAALVPEAQRRTAYSLDSMSVEVSYMIGPVLGVLVATQVSTAAAALSLGALIVGSGIGLYVLNPPVKSDAARGAQRPPVRSWLRPRLVSLLAATVACTLVLAGTDVAIIAALQSSKQVSWTGVVLAAWCAFSLVGGFVYGALHRGIPPLVLVVLLGLCTIPVGMFGSSWWVICLALAPAGLLCAPTLAAVTDGVSRVAPETIRGLVMGLHSSAVTGGFALGAPLSGAVMDATAPRWGFAVAGAVGVLLAFGAALATRGVDPRGQPVEAGPAASSAATASAIS